MGVTFRPCPDSLKSIQPYLKIAVEHDEKDHIISYWCRLYSLQAALTIDKTSNEAKALLLELMNWLEKSKKIPNVSESITSDIAAQAYIENYALKLFKWADSMDRQGQFNKNVVKSFYASGLLFDVLTTFGQLDDELVNNRKYAKWKATYIHNCLKNGETPVPGPMNTSESSVDVSDEQRELDELLRLDKNSSPPIQSEDDSKNSFSNWQFPVAPQVPKSGGPSSTATSSFDHPPAAFPATNVPSPSPGLFQPYVPSPMGASNNLTASVGASGLPKLNAVHITKAQKYCKFASSALNYDDVAEAINNLQKALTLLQTGVDPA